MNYGKFGVFHIAGCVAGVCPSANPAPKDPKAQRRTGLPGGSPVVKSLVSPAGSPAHLEALTPKP